MQFIVISIVYPYHRAIRCLVPFDLHMHLSLYLLLNLDRFKALSQFFDIVM
jgi:hypothetical protein